MSSVGEDIGTGFVKIITSIMRFTVRDHCVLSRFAVRLSWIMDNTDKILEVFMSNSFILNVLSMYFLLTT